jgi:hypothetical protein
MDWVFRCNNIFSFDLFVSYKYSNVAVLVFDLFSFEALIFSFDLFVSYKYWVFRCNNVFS